MGLVLQQGFCHPQIVRISDLHIVGLALHQRHRFTLDNENFGSIRENFLLLLGEGLVQLLQLGGAEGLRGLALIHDGIAEITWWSRLSTMVSVAGITVSQAPNCSAAAMFSSMIR